MRVSARRFSFAFLTSCLAAVAVFAGVANAASSSGTITYQTSPSYVYGFAPAAATNGFPTPSQCVKAFGLACYTPSEIRKAYDVPSTLTGAGQTIVIVDAYGSPTIRQDLHTFDQAMGLSDPTLNVIFPGGSPTYNPLQNHSEFLWAFETSLDVEWSHAIAPGATIDLVVASNNAGNVLNGAEQYAVQNHLGNVMSLSFGAPEGFINGGGNNLQLQQGEQVLDAAVAANMSVFVSSGDFGASNFFSSPNASFPSSSPDVTSVGGTNLFISDRGAYRGETTWNDESSFCPFGCTQGDFGATGGAPSRVFTDPSYAPGFNGMRSTSDVAYNASVYTGILTYLSFDFPGAPPGFYFTGGTSEGAPQWAAITALADQAAGHALGLLNPKLYGIYGNATQYGADFHDVTAGNNAWQGPGFDAGTGYDLPTGIGSPDVSNLIATIAH
jgi:subtilase family serine protease